jgi:formylglycine-generating enzyme required for sulfatase activity
LDKGQKILDGLRSPVATHPGADGAPMIRVPGGTLTVELEGQRKPMGVHTFDLQQFPVTNKDFGRFVKDNNYTPPLGAARMECCSGPPRCSSPVVGWINHSELDWHSLLTDDAVKEMPSYPVIGVSWDDASAYCKAYGMRLPTAVEWTYAAKANTTTVYWWGDKIPRFRRVGNFADARLLKDCPEFSEFGEIQSYDDGYSKTSPVGTFGGNPWGFYDMGGNVWQWVVDDYNPKCAASQEPREGGAWSAYEDYFNNPYQKNCKDEVMRSDDTGFRCASTVEFVN